MIGAVLMVMVAGLPPEFIRGMSFAHVHHRGWGYGSEASRRELAHLAEVGVTWVSITPFAYQPAVDRPELIFGEMDRSLSSKDLLAVAAQAHALGIKVVLKPHIWSSQFWYGGKWHGDIEMTAPGDTEAWFERYGAYLVSMAEIAERGHMDGLSIGVEYVRMTRPENTARWRRLIAAVRAKYRGPLTYSAHHDAEVFQIGFWKDLDCIGVNAYFPFAASLESASAAQIAAAWRGPLDRLEALSKKLDRPVVVMELGYPSHAGALSQPWRSDGDLPRDEAIQARAYEAAFSAFATRPWLRGVFLWKWFSGGVAQHGERDPYEPEGKQSEAVMRRWFVHP